MTPVLEVVDLHTVYPIPRRLWKPSGSIHAVSGVSLSLEEGETLAIVGESGSGKSTLAKSIVGLESPASGSLYFRGKDIRGLSNRGMRPVRRQIQMIFQDPFSSLHPGMTVRQNIQEPWKVHKDFLPRSEWDTEADRLIEMVGLDPRHQGNRYPHQFSGGQHQRISIARALALRPQVLICDEPVSALDVSIQAQVLNLLQDLQDELGLSYIVIAHDISVVRQLAHRVAVMYLGKIVEHGRTESVFAAPGHPYTQALLSAVPSVYPWEETDRTRIVLEGDIPSPANPPSGCRFRTRCWKAEQLCTDEEPELMTRGLAHQNACHFASPDGLVTPV